jgi:hypothetical protein
LNNQGKQAHNEDDLNGTYIIWQPGSLLPPTTTFSDRPTAIKVAHLMASKDPGKQFAVCKVVGSAKPVTVKFESYDDKPTLKRDCPF